MPTLQTTGTSGMSCAESYVKPMSCTTSLTMSRHSSPSDFTVARHSRDSCSRITICVACNTQGHVTLPHPILCMAAHEAAVVAS